MPNKMLFFFNEIDLYFGAKKHYHLNPPIFIYIIELFGPPMTFLKSRISSLYLETSSFAASL